MYNRSVYAPISLQTNTYLKIKIFHIQISFQYYIFNSFLSFYDKESRDFGDNIFINIKNILALFLLLIIRFDLNFIFKRIKYSINFLFINYKRSQIVIRIVKFCYKINVIMCVVYVFTYSTFEKH